VLVLSLCRNWQARTRLNCVYVEKLSVCDQEISQVCVLLRDTLKVRHVSVMRTWPLPGSIHAAADTKPSSPARANAVHTLSKGRAAARRRRVRHGAPVAAAAAAAAPPSPPPPPPPLALATRVATSRRKCGSSSSRSRRRASDEDREPGVVTVVVVLLLGRSSHSLSSHRTICSTSSTSMPGDGGGIALLYLMRLT
jgi:hypothetical protein